MAKIDLYFSNLRGEERLPFNIFDILLDNDDLFKLIKFTDEEPLDPSKTITDAEKRAMINPSRNNNDRRIYFSMFNDQVIDDEQVQLRIYIASDSARNNVLSDILVGFDVICHNNLTEIFDEDGQLSNRLLRMKSIILELLNGEVVKDSIGVLEVPDGRGSRLMAFNKSFQGYTFVMRTFSD